MVTIATITHKNQLTIPRSFLEGSELEGVRKVLLERRNGAVVIKPLRSKVKDLAGSLYKPGRKFVGIKKEKRLTRELIAKEIAMEGMRE